MEEFKSNLEKLQAKKQELQKLQSEVESKRVAFEQQILDQRMLFDETLLPLDESIHTLSQECGELGSEMVSVRLADLVYELSKLVGVPKKQIHLKSRRWEGLYEKMRQEESTNIINTANIDKGSEPPIILDINICKTSTLEESLSYHIAIPFDDWCIDNILLKKHIGNAIFTFKLEDLVNTLSPESVLRTAILSCLDKDVKVKTLGK